MSAEHIHRLSTSSATSTSTSSNTNVSPYSSSSNSLSYSSERICYLLNHEKQQYDIIDNKGIPSHWSVFGYPAKLNKQTDSFERIMGFTSCRKCKKTFVYGPHNGTTPMKQHPCVITADMKTSTQTPID